MRITILGCGPSGGIPSIAGEWGDCNPNNPRNRRQRSSILIQKNDKNILIDAGPDIREQLLQANICRIDAVILTHAHADHIRGLDDLKRLSVISEKLLPVYADNKTLQTIEIGYPYAIQHINTLYKPFLRLSPFSGSSLQIEGIDFIVFPQVHGNIQSWGIRIDDFAYSTDFNDISQEFLVHLQGLKCWIVDCLQFKDHLSHSSFANTMKFIEKVNPDEAILTHMNQELDYDKLIKILPKKIRPAFDGMQMEFSGEKIIFYDIVN